MRRSASDGGVARRTHYHDPRARGTKRSNAGRRAARGTMAAMTTTAESPFVRACRAPGHAAHARLVHAPGRPVAAGVPRDPRRHRRCSIRAAGPTWSARSPCSRYAATAWTRPSCSATSWCRSRRPGSTSTSCPAPGRWSPSRSRTAADVGRLRPLAPTDVSYVDEAVRLLVAELGATPLIGFAGAPFTLASYLVEGGPSRNHTQDQGDDVRRPGRSGTPCAPGSPTSRSPSSGCRSAAGVIAVQLFDSWAGALSEADYRRVRPAALGDGAARARRRGHPADPLRRGHGRAARGDGRGGRGRGRRRLADPAGRRDHAGSARTRRCRATSTPPCCSRRGRSSSARCAGCSPRAARRRATCSTSATACCRRPTPTC